MLSSIIENQNNHPDKEIIIVFNNRKDREHRIILLKEVMERIEKKPKVYTIGDYPKEVESHLT